jgi:hypothetical protein
MPTTKLTAKSARSKAAALAALIALFVVLPVIGAWVGLFDLPPSLTPSTLHR